ncbi:glycosyltransferase [Microbacterium sp. F2]|uniref:glycosyltransferase n=1 Tax=Microbacterium sp. F2 TaxID=3422228 RepID=UPI003FD0C9AF
MTVISPKIVPFHRNRLFRALNRSLLNRALQRALKGREYDLWSFSPLTYGIEDSAKIVVYHSVDLLHRVAGVDTELILAAERELVASATHVIASSYGVYEHLRRVDNRDVLLWENVADISKYIAHRSDVRERVCLFAGNLTPEKVDFQSLIDVSRAGIRVKIAGPIGIDGSRGRSEVDRLLQEKNVEYLGVLSQDELATVAGTALVGLIPYRLNSYTDGVFPMKVYEYIAAGLRVVATPLPSLASGDVPALRIIDDLGFVQAVSEEIAKAETAPPSTQGMNLHKHSWEYRIHQCQELLDWSSDE